MTEQNIEPQMAFFDPKAAHEYNVRLECLKLVNDPRFPEESVDAARLYEDYLLGTNDVDVIRAARELAEKVGTDE